jgi:DNA helicase-2/ATP-dependent DNA helicase PcrA
VLARLRRGDPGTGVVEALRGVTDALGYDPEGAPDVDEEITRQADLGRLRQLAQEYEDAHGPDATLTGFVEELAQRFATQRQGRGVQLMTYHRSKGLEFDAVFLPRLLDGEVPYRSRRSEADPDEERRLLYVGITRARTHLWLSWPREPRTAPSPFLEELGVRREPSAPAPGRRGAAVAPAAGGPLYERLRTWRKARAQADGVPAYVVFHDATLAAIAELAPRDLGGLGTVSGVGPAKLERYGEDVLAVVRQE